MLIKLILAHFMGDYLFQTRKVVQWKNRSWPGHFIHYGIVGLCNLVLCWDTLQRLQVTLGLLAVTFAHLVVDESKIAYLKSRPEKDRWETFLLDQGIHALIILAIGAWWEQCGLKLSPPDRMGDVYLWLSVMISNTYAISIVIYYLFKTVDPKNAYRRDYLLMAARLGITTMMLSAGPVPAAVLLTCITWGLHRVNHQNRLQQQKALAGNALAFLISLLVYLLI